MLLQGQKRCQAGLCCHLKLKLLKIFLIVACLVRWSPGFGQSFFVKYLWILSQDEQDACSGQVRILENLVSRRIRCLCLEGQATYVSEGQDTCVRKGRMPVSGKTEYLRQDRTPVSGRTGYLCQEGQDTCVRKTCLAFPIPWWWERLPPLSKISYVKKKILPKNPANSIRRKKYNCQQSTKLKQFPFPVLSISCTAGRMLIEN